MLKQLRESQEAFGEYEKTVENIRKKLWSDITMLQQLHDMYYNDIVHKREEALEYQAELCKIIEKYSKFDLRVIGPVLADIASVFEGKKYVFSETKNCDGCAFLAPESNTDHLKGNIILKSKMNSESEKQKYMLKFYSTYDRDDVCPNISYGTYGEFDYLREYIDRVIQYKSENEVDTISQEELETLKWDFLAESMPTISMKHQTMFDEEEQRIQTIISDRNERSMQFKKTESMLANGEYVKK